MPQGEFLDDGVDSLYSWLNFGYGKEELFLFPEKPAQERKQKQDTSEVATSEPVKNADSSSPYQLQHDNLTPDQVMQLDKMVTSLPDLFSGDNMPLGVVPGAQPCIRTILSVFSSGGFPGNKESHKG